MKPAAWPRGLLLLLFLAAFALRLYRLDLQDVWWDEARNIDVAARPLTQIATAWELDIHPPVYFYVLHGWLGAAGHSAFAIRFLSTGFGVLLIALMVALGRRVAGAWGGAGAGLGAACLPFLLGEAQEARMYTMVLVWLAAAALALVRLARTQDGIGQGRRWLRWVLPAVFSALALLTHYAAVFALAALWGWAGISALAAPPRGPAHLWARVRPLLLGGVLTALLCLPGLPVALRQIPGYRNPNLVVPPVGGFLAELARVYSLGEHFDPALARLWMIALGVLLVGGWLAYIGAARGRPTAPSRAISGRSYARSTAPSRATTDSPDLPPSLEGKHPERVDGLTRVTTSDQSKDVDYTASPASFDSGPQSAAALRSGGSTDVWSRIAPLALAVLWAVLPLVIYYLVISDRATSATRYISVALPGWLLLGGVALAGWARVHRVLGPVMAVALVVILVPGLWTDQTDARFFRDDTRGLIAWLDENTDPARDIVLVDQRYPFGFYYERWNNLAGGFPPDQPASVTPAQYLFVDVHTLADRLTQLTQGRTRVFWVRWFESDTDPRGAVPFMLEKFGTQTGERAFRGYTLTWYTLAPDTRFELAQPLTPVQTAFGDQVRLEGVAYGGHGPGETSTLEESRAAVAPADQSVWAVVQWSALPGAAALRQGVKATLILVDANGLVAARDDRALLNDRHLAPLQWAEEDRPLGVFLLRPEPATAPGTYTLKLAVYDPVTLAQLPATGPRAEGTFVTLGEVSLARATRAPAVEQLPLDTPMSFSWRGLRLLGRGPLPTSLSPGDRLDVDLYWQAEQVPLPDLGVELVLQPADATDAPLVELPFALIANGYLTVWWDAGETVRDRQVWQLPPEAAGGSYRLLLRLLAGDGASPAVELGTVEVAGRAHSFELPADMAQTAAATFGEVGRLLGYDGPTITDGALALTLYWQALNPSASPHNVSVQLLDANGVLAAQRDQPPGGGAYPTTGWVAGEVLTDAYRVDLPPDLPRGTYTVIVKLYDAATFAPLPVSLPDGRDAGEYLRLAEIEIR